MFDNEKEQDGMLQACNLIQGNLSNHVKEKLGDTPIDGNTFKLIDEALMEFYDIHLKKEARDETRA